MMCYLNRGLILEQAICSLIHDYFEILKLDHKYSNFHISVTTDHPFADLYSESGRKASDSFPCVVVSTEEDNKPGEFDELAPNVEGVGVSAYDLAAITSTTEKYIDKKGREKEREIPGLCTVADAQTIAAIQDTIDRQEYCYGFSIRTRRRDNINLEIWAENSQLKNEIYEQLRLFVTGNLRNILTQRYPFFDIAIFDNTVIGHRSNNYNFDFDVLLCGAHISFDVNYCVEQLILDTEKKQLTREIIVEVINEWLKSKD